jgi:para-aminobenzoate synthetase component 1
MSLGPLVENLGPARDPAEVAARFLDLPYLLLLDSATAQAATRPTTGDGHQLGHYSFLAADPWRVVQGKGAVTRMRDSSGGWTSAPGDPLLAVQEVLAAFAAEPVSGLPPFQGGVAGYVGYDYGGVLERLPAARFDDLAIPDVVLGMYDWVIAWDHRLDTAWVISTGLPETGLGRERRARERLSMVQARLAGPAIPAAHASRPSQSGPDCPPAPSYPVKGVDEAESIGLRSTFTHRGYLDAVTRVREYIVAGDIFQANLSQRFEGPLTEPAFDLYCRLRTRNPAAFAAYLNFGDLQVLSASPERFLRLDENRRDVETRPIKGTRPRRPR